MTAKELMKSSYISVDKNESISRLIGKFKTSKKENAVVLDGEKYAGIVSKRKFLNAKIQVDEEKIQKLIIKTAVLDGSESDEQTARLMYNSDVHMLPVVKNGTVMGVVYAIDILNKLKLNFTKMKVNTGKVLAIDQHTSIASAIKIMRMKKVGKLPLVTKANKLSGIVSIFDLVMKYSMFPGKRAGGHNVKARKSSPGKEKEGSSIPVIYEATTDVITARAGDSMINVINLMSKNNISDVVVLDDDNQPAGIVTIKDLLKIFS